MSEFLNRNRKYPRLGRQYAQSLSSSANIEQGEHLPASIDLLDDSFLTPLIIPSSSAAQASLPIQTSLSRMPVLRQSYLDIAFGNRSRTWSVEAPVPISHAARTKAGLRTIMPCDNQDTLNHNSGFVGGETLKITNVRTRGDLDNNGLHTNVQVAMDYNTRNNKQTTATGPSKLVIRPISPATLMALTEPCLMAWCTAFDESLAQPGSSPCLPLQNLDDIDKINVWGY